MDRQRLVGFFPAIVTPFDDAGAIDEDAFARLADWLISIGARGLCVAGDNGESWALSAAERGRLTELAVRAAAGRVPVVTGASAPTLAAARDYARAAVDNGAEALLAMPPTYVLKGSAEEVCRRYVALAEAAGVPIVAYNSPRRAGYSLPLDLLDRLLGEAPIIAIKESDRDFFRLSHLIHRFRDRLQVMVGPAHLILPGLALGAAGYIASGPELLGPDGGRLKEVALAAPDETSRRLHHQLTTLYEALMGSGTWPSALKAALTMIGQPAGTTRDPVSPLAPEAHAALAGVLRDLGIATVAGDAPVRRRAVR